jgi:hypothetical protein
MRAFSVIELVFIIVIMGIMTYVGLEYIPDNTLIADTQMLKQKILEKKSNALGYKVNESNETCITFDKVWLNNDDYISDDKVHYKFKTDISAEYEGNHSKVTKICFDYLGRPYSGKVNEYLTDLMNDNIIISLKDIHNNEKNITIYKISGSIR